MLSDHYGEWGPTVFFTNIFKMSNKLRSVFCHMKHLWVFVKQNQFQISSYSCPVTAFPTGDVKDRKILNWHTWIAKLYWITGPPSLVSCGSKSSQYKLTSKRCKNPCSRQLWSLSKLILCSSSLSNTMASSSVFVKQQRGKNWFCGVGGDISQGTATHTQNISYAILT